MMFAKFARPFSVRLRDEHVSQQLNISRVTNCDLNVPPSEVAGHSLSSKQPTRVESDSEENIFDSPSTMLYVAELNTISHAGKSQVHGPSEAGQGEYGHEHAHIHYHHGTKGNHQNSRRPRVFESYVICGNEATAEVNVDNTSHATDGDSTSFAQNGHSDTFSYADSSSVIDPLSSDSDDSHDYLSDQASSSVVDSMFSLSEPSDALSAGSSIVYSISSDSDGCDVGRLADVPVVDTIGPGCTGVDVAIILGPNDQIDTEDEVILFENVYLKKP